MSLWNTLKNQLIDVIEWLDESSRHDGLSFLPTRK